MKWLFDTNVVSENVSRQANASVIRWILARPPEETAISVVTLAELRDGAFQTADPGRRDELTRWIDSTVAKSFAERTLPLTVDVLLHWIGLTRKLGAKGRPQAAADLLIASTARVYDLTLVTRNTRDFADTGITVYNPWTNETHDMEAP